MVASSRTQQEVQQKRPRPIQVSQKIGLILEWVDAIRAYEVRQRQIEKLDSSQSENETIWLKGGDSIQNLLHITCSTALIDLMESRDKTQQKLVKSFLETIAERSMDEASPSTIEEFIKAYEGLVLFFVHQECPNSTDAQDIKQEVLITAMKNFNKSLCGRSAREQRAWLRTTAINRTRDYRRKQLRQPVTTESSLDDPVAWELSLGDKKTQKKPTLAAEIDSLVDRMVSELDNSSKKAILQGIIAGKRDGGKFRIKDIAESLGVTPSTASTEWSRFRKKVVERAKALVEARKPR